MMTAKELMEILEATAHNTGVSLDKLRVEMRDDDWYFYDITGYDIDNDGRTVILEFD